MNFEFEAFAAQNNVSRETIERLEIFHTLLLKWNKKINLVAPNTLENAWSRHFLDSAQLFRFAPPAGHWADIGSGGGFPGAVVGIMAADVAELRVTLVESDRRKCAFLRTVARETEAKFTVLTSRIEQTPQLNADVLSARALTSLTSLLEFAKIHLSPNGFALFLKGKKAKQEISEALEQWSFGCETLQSETDSEAVVLKIGGVKRV